MKPGTRQSGRSMENREFILVTTGEWGQGTGAENTGETNKAWPVGMENENKTDSNR